MNKRFVILVVIVLSVLASLAALTRKHDVVLISGIRGATENGKTVVRFLAQNKTSINKRVTVEISAYSEKFNGISAEPDMAGVRKAEFSLNPNETKTITEEMSIMKNPSVLVQSHLVDVRIVAIE